MSRHSIRPFYQVAGLLSLSRVPLAVAFVLLLDRPYWPFVVLAASALSDVLDGWYARTFGQTTETGRILDAVVDKIFVAVVVIALLVAHRLSIVQALALTTRDVGELLIGLHLAAKSRRQLAQTHAPNPLGKVTTLFQYVTVSAAIAIRGVPVDVLAGGTGLLGVLAALTYWQRERKEALRRRAVGV